MIIVLNRGKNNQDFREDFHFEEILNFASPNTVICNPQTYSKYYLCGIITYKGKNDSNGHYITYFRNDINSNFLCYNDTFVEEVSVVDAFKTKISKKDNDDTILIYYFIIILIN